MKKVMGFINIIVILFFAVSVMADQANLESPFGMSGAYSRPYITTDNISQEEVYAMVSALEQPYKDVQEMSIKWVRPGIDITWELVQPGLEYVQNGVYDWTLVDSLYGRIPNGVSVLANVGLNQGLAAGSWNFINPQAEQDYIKFIKNVVERYDGDGTKDMPGLTNPIRYWQTHNEPSGNPGLGVPITDWQGFSHIQEITYKAIKESDPEAKVAMGGFAQGHRVNSNDPLFTQEYDGFFLPILQTLRGKYIDIFDIHCYGAGMEWPSYWKKMKEIFTTFRQTLDENGYQNTEIWFTETALPTQPFGEKIQAADLVKRYIYPVSFGAKKVFWWNMIEGERPLLDNAPSDHYGVIYDGVLSDDPGFATKKLSYYAYKKMIEVLEGSDWDNIETVQKKNDIYIYKFSKNGNPIWVAWNDSSQEKQITISSITANQVKITKAIPQYDSGKEVTNYSTAFSTETKSVTNQNVTINLEDSPIFVEALQTCYIKGYVRDNAGNGLSY